MTVAMRPGLGRDQLGAVGAVDHANRQIEDQVHQPLARNLRDQFFQPGADARQGARLGKQGKENRRAHDPGG